MADALNKLAVQFAEQNREDQRGLRGELAGLRHVLSAILLQQGGGFVLDDRCRMLATPDDELGFVVDTWNRCLRITRMSGQRAPEPVVERVEERLPDWML